MIFKEHYDLKGKHAILSPSNYHWLGYDDNKMVQTYLNQLAVKKGTELHELAQKLIQMRIKLPKNKETLSMYVNDAIGFRMTPEQPLYFSPRCFGTADAICFRKNFLRIHDLKTGATPASLKQLECYAALFCLEYGKKPSDIDIECRIYQSGQVIVHTPDPNDIAYSMDTIVRFDKIITDIDSENYMEE